MQNKVGARPLPDTARILFVVEGTNDIEFLKRISLLLHNHDPTLPNLADWERSGELIFVPFGGGHVRAWGERLAPLGKPEFHLYDREVPPETDYRQRAADTVNFRQGCRATLTRKRCLENYLHPAAIQSAGQVEVEFGDFEPVAETTAKQLHATRIGEPPWELLPQRARNRMAHRIKRWLNTTGADQMTVSMLDERDPDGEVLSWLKAINSLARVK